MFNELSWTLYKLDSSYCWLLELVSDNFFLLIYLFIYLFFKYVSLLSVNTWLWMYQSFWAEVEPNSIFRFYYISILRCVWKHNFTVKSSFSSQAKVEFKLSGSRIINMIGSRDGKKIRIRQRIRYPTPIWPGMHYSTAGVEAGMVIPLGPRTRPRILIF